MSKNYKFGDKTFGRSPLERLVLILESNGLLNRLLIIFSTLGIIGLNSLIRTEYDNGIIYFLLVILILLSKTKVSENFFGSSALAICIVLHIAIFGFSGISLVLSFVTYIVFRRFMDKHILFPILVYLIFDTIALLSNKGEYLRKLMEGLGMVLFDLNFLIVLFLLPFLYCYYCPIMSVN
ncbi:hypothetical protein CIG75_05920 [Tumebacillus algifaecis]|uniref:Uncharacterized protein n=1 Tax=Tumebacillus algifaecis TaxID=1214604 RepID=A0A223CZA1_9BACL|nr:hypothetical protein CIG75_05920 [Tumebacillus algifaecis]